MSSNGKYGNQLIKVYNRKIARNRLKNRIKSNGIKESWMNIQIANCKRELANLSKLIKDKKVIRTKYTNRIIKGLKRYITVRLKEAQR